jgi:DNA-binding NarL/FixJ family response regulator
MHAVCIARHRILSDHICSVFRAAGIACEAVVGFAEGMKVARSRFPDVVICDYDLLVAAPLDEWERDALLVEVPIIAVSLTRRPEEAHLANAREIAGFLYLPTIEEEMITRMLHAAAGRDGVRAPEGALRWNTSDAERLRRD